MKTKKTKNLLKTDFGYCFRMIVPEGLREVIGLREIRYSLKERSLTPARKKANQLTKQVKGFFSSVRLELKENPEALDRDKLNAFVRNMVTSTIKSMSDDFALNPFNNAQDVRDAVGEADLFLHDMREALALGDFTSIHPLVEIALQGLGLQAEPDSHEYKLVASQIMRGQIEIMEARAKMSAGDFSFTQRQQVVEAKVKAKQQNGATLGEIAENYWNENVASWKAATEKEYKLFNATMLKFFGEDVQLHELSFEDGRNYREYLQGKRPLNGELKLTPAGNPMSESRRNDYLTFAQGVWTYAIRLHHATENILEGLKTKKRKVRADKQRAIYSQEELEVIFCHSPEYNGSIKRADLFFISLIALYSGMRIEEICGLDCEDIQEIDGVQCFKLEEREGRSLKTLSSERIVPVHSKLIEIGLLEYRETVGSGRLFPKLKPQNTKYSHSVSKWYGKFKTRMGFGRDLTFHSFRHNFSSQLSYAGVDVLMIDALTGHAPEGMTASRYIKDHPVELLKAELEKLDYGLSVDHLKETWLAMEI